MLYSYHCQTDDISIHALREEGDGCPKLLLNIHQYFYPRPPRGGRPREWQTSQAAKLFLSTPSARRATWQTSRASHEKGISIHALREEGDCPLRCRKMPLLRFLSTPSARRATSAARRTKRILNISIHALREEGDGVGVVVAVGVHDFYPRPPRGGRPLWVYRSFTCITFLSTPSARRAT